MAEERPFFDTCKELDRSLAEANAEPECPHRCFLGPDGGRWTVNGPCPRQRVHDREAVR